MRVIYIDIDSLRPDHLGCYGYGRPTSPLLDSIAAAGVRFTRYFAGSTPCVPSRATLFSGRPGIRNGIEAHENTPAASTFRFAGDARGGPAPTLAAHLSRHGYHTASISTFADRHRATWFTLGFQEFHVPSLKGGNEDAPEVNAVAVPWLQRNAARDNWFLHVNYWDPHTLYTEPLEYSQRMAAYPAPAWPDAATIARQQGDIGVRCASTMWGDTPHDGFTKSRTPATMPDGIATRANYELLMNGYDGAIRYLDDQLHAVFDAIKAAGVWDDTAILISADHAESFGELGQYIEHGSASTSVHHVPLIVRWPGLTDAAAGTAREDHLLSSDFAPTSAAALGLPIPGGWPGVNFVDALKNDGPPKQPPLVWSHGLHTRQRAVYDGDWLYIRTYDPGCHTYPPRMLFHLATDPHETTDLAGQHYGRVATMDAILQKWEAEQLAATGQPDPMRLALNDPPKSVTMLESFYIRLERAGRHADALRLRNVRARIANAYAWKDLER